MRICTFILMHEKSADNLDSGETPLRMLYPSTEARAQLGNISEPKFRRLTASGKLKTRKIGSRVYVESEDLRAFIASLPTGEREEAS